VRLRNAYVIKCEDIIKNPTSGEIQELHCSIDLDTLGKKPEGRKVKGVIHWVSAQHSQLAEVRLYDRLFSSPNPDIGDVSDEDDADADAIGKMLNPDSLIIKQNCRLEQSLTVGLEQSDDHPARYQFEREGYFIRDQKLSTAEMPVYNRIVSLRDTWAKIEKKPG
jgi:glutaminyl-tRNA synthetase